MFIRMKHAMAAGVLLIAALGMHAPYPLTLLADVLMINFTIGLFHWMERRRGEVEDRERRSDVIKLSKPRRPSPSAGYREVESRWKLALAVIVILYVTFISQFRTVEHFLVVQSQRTIENEVERLLAANKWQEAAKYLEDYLRRPLAAELRARAQVLLHNCWLHLIDAATPAELAGILSAAEGLASNGCIDPDLVANLRQHIERAKKVARVQADIERARRETILVLERERSQRQTAESLAAERANTIQSRDRDWQQKLAEFERKHDEQHFQLLLDWAESLTTNLPLQRGQYHQAIDFGRRHTFDTRSGEQRLVAVEAALAAAEPRELATGTTARLIFVSGDRHPPAIEAELYVLDAAGHPVEGLASKDFRIAIDGQPAGRPHAGFVVPPAARLQVVILTDHSGSTAGATLAAAKAGIARLLQQLDGYADVSLVAFSGTVVPLTSWGADYRVAVSRVTGLQAGGGTAIYDALGTAASLLRERSTPRLIVLFSDGKDSTKALPEPVLDRLRGEQIVVHAVGLETAEFDRPAIERITAATGGTLLTAGRAMELATRFDQLAQSLNAPRYRLVIPCEQPVGQLRISIGGLNAVSLETPLEEKQTLPLAKH